MFIDQEFDLQEWAERYTRALIEWRAAPRGSREEQHGKLERALRSLYAASLRYSAFVVGDRAENPNAREREIPSMLEALAARALLQRLAAEQLQRDPYTWPDPAPLHDEPSTGPCAPRKPTAEDTAYALRERADAFRQFSRNGRWGTCGACPRDGAGQVLPELCEFTARYDHQLEARALAENFEAFRSGAGR